MQRFLVCSDIHGKIKNFEYALREALYENIDGVILAGDFEMDISTIKALINELSGENCGVKLYAVRGNCDSSGMAQGAPDFQLFNLNDKVKCFLTHGHNYQVKYDLDTLQYVAEYKGAAVCVYGHTHIYEDRVIGKTRFINPGALRGGFDKPSYALLTVDGTKIDVLKRVIN